MNWVLLGLVAATLIYQYYASNRKRFTPQEWGEDVPQANEGIAVPVLFGERQIDNPNIIYFGNTKRIEDKNFSGNPQKYYASIAFGLCHGYVDSIKALLVGDKVIWDAQVSGGESKTASVTHFFTGGNADGVIATFLVKFGRARTTPDDGSAAHPLTGLMKLGSKGPQYHGLCHVVFENAYLGNAPQLRPMGFRASRIMTRNGGLSEQWYPSKARIVMGRNRTDTWKYRLQSVVDATDFSGVSFDDSEWDTGPGGFGNAPINSGGAGNEVSDTGIIGTTYRTPRVGTCVNGGTGCSGTWPNLLVASGTKLWVRYDLGSLPTQDMGVRLWHDDEARLWFNGTELDCSRIESDKDPEFWRFNSRATIPAALINSDGPNVIAYRVQDTGGGEMKRIYAGIQVGPNVDDPCAVVTMNGAHIIYEALTDTSGFGRRLPEAKLDDGAFRAAADTLYNEHLGLSFLWSKQGSVRELIDEVLRHISGVLYEDPFTGKIVLKLIRNDYVEGNLTVLGEDDVRTVTDASRRLISELINTVTVTYSKAPEGKANSGSTTVQETGLLRTRGAVNLDKREYPWVADHITATKLAMRDLRVLCTPTWSMRIHANRKAAKLHPGQAFKLVWSPLDINSVFRVNQLDRGDGVNGEVVLSVTEDAFHTPSRVVAVPAAVGFPPIELGPLPGSTSATKYYLKRTYDPNNFGQAVCVYTGYEGCGEWFMFAGFEELEDGQVLQATSLGPLTSNAFDGVDLDMTGHYTSSMIGRTIFAWAPELTNNRAKYCGWWIIEDLGGHYEEDQEQEGVWVWVNTYARFRRHPGFAESGAFKQGMTVQLQTGNQWGTGFLTLESPAVVLNETEQDWSYSAEHTWNTARVAVDQDQLTTEPISLETIEESRYATGADFEAFPMLDGSPAVKTIPAGPWIFEFEGVKVTGLLAGYSAQLGMKVWRSTGLLFESVGPNLTSTEFEAKSWKADMPRYLISEDEEVIFIPTLHSDSPTPITITFFHGPNNGTAVTVPFEPVKTALRAHHMQASRTGMASGVIIIPEGAETAEVDLSAGDEIKGIILQGAKDGFVLWLTINGGTNENPIKLKHQSAGLPVEAASLWLASTDNAGNEYGDLEIYCDRTRLGVQYRKADNSFSLLPGGSIG